ncbi:MAG TPA: hypothetical protein VGJ81_04830 [Thermoanaerobaculia bacterium]|jgi:hypothetical protein
MIHWIADPGSPVQVPLAFAAVEGAIVDDLRTDPKLVAGLHLLPRHDRFVG